MVITVQTILIAFSVFLALVFGRNLMYLKPELIDIRKTGLMIIYICALLTLAVLISKLGTL
jgi:hypothetical protein